MNIYEKNFSKYAELSNRDYADFSNVINTIEKVKVPTDKDYLHKTAVVLLGFSGNGKTSYINNAIGEHPFLKVISMDEIGKGITDEFGYNPSSLEYGLELTKRFGNQLEKSKNSNIIIDGRFLNLFTRMALIDTLHELNYKVNLVDIRSIINDTLPNRVFDEYRKRTKDRMNINLYNQIQREIYDFYRKEKQQSFINLQDEYQVVDYSIENYYTFSDNIKDIVNDKNPKRK